MDASRLVGSFDLSEHALQPVDGLGIPGPEPPGELHDEQLERRLAVAVRPGPFESSSVVRQIGENPTARGEPLGLGKPGHLAEEEVAVTAADGVVFARQSQSFVGVVAKRLPANGNEHGRRRLLPRLRATCPRVDSRTSKPTIPVPDPDPIRRGSSSLITATAASTSNRPGKTPSRRSPACSTGDSRSWLQSSAARSVWCHETTVRAPPVRSPKQSSNRSRICSTLSIRMRAAASSMARGMPSRRRQIPATVAALLAVKLKPRPASAAQSQNSTTDSAAATAAKSTESLAGTERGGTGKMTSPGRPSAYRLGSQHCDSGTTARRDCE